MSTYGILHQPRPSPVEEDIAAAQQAREQVPLPEGDVLASPTGEERNLALRTGFARGAAESASVMAPMMAGAKTGFFLGGPKGGLIGGVGGAATGLFAADALGKLFPEVAREDLSFAYEGARTVGGGVAFSPAAFLFRKAGTGANKVQETIGAIGEFARKYPTKYLATESVVSLYAGLAGGAAVAMFPEQPIVRPVAEVAASAFMPARLVLQLKDTVANTINKVFVPSTVENIPDNVRNYVGTQLVNVFQDAGEDPAAFVRLLQESLDDLPLSPDGVRVRPTVAQMTGSKTATAFEKLLARNHAKYAVDTVETGLETMLAYKQAALAMQSTGDPAMMRAAAQLRKESMEMQFQTAINQAQTAAFEKASLLGATGSDVRAASGSFLRDELQKFQGVGRVTEKNLWDTAIRGVFRESGGQLEAISIRPNNLANALYDITSSPYSSTSRSALNKDLRSVGADLKRVGLDKSKFEAMEQLPLSADYLDTRTLSPEALAALDVQDVSALDLVRLRSAVLEKARDAGSAGKSGAAQRYNRLAEAILDDLEALPGTGYDDARAFSKAFRDVFNRTFVGELDRVNRRGQEMYSPEVLVQKAFASGADTTLMRMKDMENAANFIDPSGAAATSIREAEQKVLRAFAAETIEDGVINLQKFDSFRTKHADALRYLGMENEFADIASAQRSLLDIAAPDTRMSEYMRNESVFASLLDSEDPIFAISNAINSQTPVRHFRYLTELANDHRTPKAARDGLLSNVYQYAYQTADKGADGFNARAFHDVFFKPLSPNNPSLANVLRATGVLPDDELRRLRQLSQKMLNVEEAMRAGGSSLDPTKVFTPADAVENLAIAMLGAKFAGAISPGGPGSLTFASRSIQMTQNFLSGMPARNRLLILQEATKDGNLMADLMRRGMDTVEEQAALQRSMLRYLYPSSVFPAAAARYITEIEDEDITEQRERLMESTGAAELLRQLPPAPATRGTPNLQLQTPDQGPAGEALEQMPTDQGPMPGPTSSSREMFQRLFPNEMS